VANTLTSPVAAARTSLKKGASTGVLEAANLIFLI